MGARPPRPRPWGQAGGSRRAAYQEAFKLLGFCDVNPAVLLHHLNVLHLVVEPGKDTAPRSLRGHMALPLGGQTREPSPTWALSSHLLSSPCLSVLPPPHLLQACLRQLVCQSVCPPLLPELRAPSPACTASPATSGLGVLLTLLSALGPLRLLFPQRLGGLRSQGGRSKA